MKNNKKVGTIFIVLFIAFAVSGFISVETGWFFLPIIIWFAFFITMIVVAKNNIKNAKNDPKFKEMKDAFKRFYEENKTTPAQEEEDIFEEAVDRTRYDSCDNEDCDSHTSSGKTKKCPLCGVMNDSNAKYCKICGEELDSDRF